MKQKIFAVLSFIMFVVVLSACTKQRAVRVGGNTQPTYVFPETYQAHRDQQQFFDTPDGKIAYTDHGAGDVIVLLHGVPTSSWMYRKIIPDLQKSHRVISVDLLGYGSSSKPGDEAKAYSHDQQAVRVQTLLKGLGVSDYTVLMHDMGGLVAWEMLRRDPEAISHLVVLNTIVSQQGFNHPDINPGMMTRQLMKAYGSKLTSAVVLKKTFDDLGLTGEFELSEAECFGYVKPMREGSDPALYAFFTSINDTLFQRLSENAELFRQWRGKTLVLWGGKDSILTTGQIPVLQKMLNVPESNIHIYTDHAHFLAEEMPEEIVARINAFKSLSDVR